MILDGEEYTYYMCIPETGYEFKVPDKLLQTWKEYLECSNQLTPKSSFELQARFSGGWLTYNPESKEFE